MKITFPNGATMIDQDALFNRLNDSGIQFKRIYKGTGHIQIAPKSNLKCWSNSDIAILTSIITECKCQFTCEIVLPGFRTERRDIHKAIRIY